MPSPRRSAARAAIVSVFVAGALAAPATVASAAGRATRCPAGTAEAVVTAYANVFSRATPLEAGQRAASLAGGEDPAIRALLERWLADPAGATTTVTVDSVRCTSRNRAAVAAELVLAGTPMPGVTVPARAVRGGATWRVATSTFCWRMVLEDPALADAGACARGGAKSG